MEREPPSPRPARRLRLISRKGLKRVGVLLGVLTLGLGGAWWRFINMPGTPHTGPLPAATAAQTALAGALRGDVELLAGEHGDRHTFNPLRYAAAAAALRARLVEIGYSPADEPFGVGGKADGCLNVYAELRGTTRPDEWVIVGAHYDAYMETPGADDNASGVAGVLALAERFANDPQGRSIRWVLFANEEPPHFMTDDMGSHRHAQAALARGERVMVMLSLEMLGYYDAAPGSQHYPFPLSVFYPDRGDFIAFVGNMASASWVRRSVGRWRERVPFPAYGAALPEGIPGIGFSDHRCFWAAGYPALMVTDTAFFRNPHYHKRSDTPETLDYERMARVVEGLDVIVRDLTAAE